MQQVPETRRTRSPPPLSLILVGGSVCVHGKQLRTSPRTTSDIAWSLHVDLLLFHSLCAPYPALHDPLLEIVGRQHDQQSRCQYMMFSVSVQRGTCVAPATWCAHCGVPFRTTSVANLNSVRVCVTAVVVSTRATLSTEKHSAAS